MGLLDNFMAFAASPEGSALAGGLLSHNGSRGWAEGSAGMERARILQQEMEMKRQFQAMQMQNYASEIEQRKAAIQKQAEIQKIMKGMFGGGQAPMSQGAFDTPAVDGVGPTIPQAMQRQAQNPGLAGQSIDQIAMLHAAGGPNLMDAYKWVKEPQKLEGGSTYENRATGAREMIPKMPDGMVFNNGAASLVPGYAGALGQVTAATEGAKAGLDLVEVPLGNGQSQKMTRAEAAKLLSGQSTQIPSIGQMQPTPQQLAMIAADAKANGIGNPVINFNQQAQPNPSSFGRTQSPAELATQEADKARLVDLAKADASKQAGDISKSSSFKDFRQQLGMAETLLNSGPTNSAFGSNVDKVAGWFGASPASANVAASLKTLSGWMMQNIPKAPGAQSDAELKDYKTAAGLVGDETVPVPQRLAALKVVNRIVDNWEAKMQGGNPPTIDNQKPDNATKPTLLDAMPKANPSNKGQRIRDTVTGEILKSNGMTWVKE